MKTGARSPGTFGAAVANASWQVSLALETFQGEVQIWSVRPPRVERAFKCGGDPSNALSWSSDGRYLACNKGAQGVFVLDTEREGVWKVPVRGPASHLAWRPRSSEFATSSIVGFVEAWDASEKALRATLRSPPAGHRNAVEFPLAWNGRGLAVPALDHRSLELYEGAKYEKTVVPYPGARCRWLEWSPRREQLYASDGKTLWVVEGNRVARASVLGANAAEIQWGPTDAELAWIDEGQAVGTWVRSGERHSRRLASPPLSLAWHPSDRILAIGCADGTVLTSKRP